MKRYHSIISAFAISSLFVAMIGCNPAPLTEADVFTNPDAVANILQPGDSVYHLNDFVATFMTEQGNFLSDSTPYRTRATTGKTGIYLFSIDTIPTDTMGIYIRGRVSSDDYGGNFYKSIVIQEIVDGKQQNLRISVDMGSANGLYQIGQELLIRCNGLSIGRYANQPQLCVPSYNNNIYANNESQKVGWAPGRIPNEIFRKATTLIGTPDQTKLQYDTITIADFIGEALSYTLENMQRVREMDGMLVCIKDIHFTSEYDNNGTPTACTEGDPETDENANVFAPTTNNLGFPQGRIFMDAANRRTLVSTSEYAKFARYYLPDAEYVGTVTGILGFYADNAQSVVSYGLDGYEWSISMRDIFGKNAGLKDLDLTNANGEKWIPKEYKPTNSTDSTTIE